MEAVNAEATVENGLAMLWPPRIQRDKVITFTNDGPNYMTTAFDLLKAR